ncbi:FIG00710469: hypothetical protein [bacterium endosymbiont of Bathymodiolus sp. 5 South]|jgi:hypothetical protein|nr:hypothetical protein [uncultured Gammaproteobacteria bacterium]SHN93860.1 FIG00710469: hypothetical protein [bacterium endosymbiont of Bathymodiolus sp. 5 South]VVH55195.1 FIG00710469: hypothetical protein [uncultured Gammaproteobacteria bacterium]
MSERKLGSILKKMYNSALQGEKVTQIYLFAISYAKEIQRNNYRIAEIIRFSAISQSFQTEVSKGVKLAQYVEILGNNHILETKNFAELGQILKLMYDNSAEREATTAIRLFGIRYALEINNCEHSIATITIAAGLSRNYAVEISKGIKLAKYVKCKSIVDEQFNTKKITYEINKPIIKSRFKKLQETGLKAETYFINNYNDIDIFKDGTLQDARLFGDGYDFQIDTNNNFYLAEVKGIKENKGRFRLTENEYQKAIEYKNDYIVTLVLNLNKKPRFLQVENPIKNLKFKEKKINTKITKEYHLISDIS